MDNRQILRLILFFALSMAIFNVWMALFAPKPKDPVQKMEKIFGLVDQYCYQGHTHIPGVFTEDLNFLSPQDFDQQYTLGEQKVLVNVGSVGQPRDGDNRACYVVLNEKTVTYRRVDYDFDSTAKKIYDIPDLDNFLGDRLRDGR